MARDGCSLVEIDSVTKTIPPGCLSGLFGGRATFSK